MDADAGRGVDLPREGIRNCTKSGYTNILVIKLIAHYLLTKLFIRPGVNSFIMAGF